MKLKNLMLKNFGAVSEVSVNFSDSLTYFIGVNKSGKTAIGLHGVWFILQGLAAKAIDGSDVLLAQRWRFIGPHGKSAKGTIEVYDEKAKVTHTITRKLLKDKTQLEIKSSDGVERGQEFLDSLFSSILIDPRRFFKLSPKAQALAFGVDTSKFDDQRKILEIERLEIHREKTRLKEMIKSTGEVETVKEVSIAELLKELSRRREHNNQIRQEEKKLESLDNEVGLQEHYINDILDKIKELEEELKETKKRLLLIQDKRATKNTFVSGLKLLDESEIEKQIEEAEEVNAKARKYEEYMTNLNAHGEEMAKHMAKDDEISVLDAKRTKYIQAQKLPYNNITISNEGEFRIAGKPFQEPYFSTGEALKFGAILGAKIAERRGGDKLDYVWISGCQDLDEENREKLFQSLVKQGLQVVAEFVDTKKQKKGHSILLKECRTVDSYEEDKTGAELT